MCKNDKITKAITEISNWKAKLNDYMNPKSAEDKHDYVSENDIYAQSQLAGKLKAYQKVIDFLEKLI